MSTINEVIFDVETQKLFDEVKGRDVTKLGVSVVSAYARKLDKDLNEIKGKMYSFWEDDLSGLWDLFQNAERIIGFNSIYFDVPVLQPYAQIPLHKLPHFDMMAAIKEILGRRVGLNTIAEHTLGSKKTDVGTNAVVYWKRGDKASLEKLKNYCEADVLLTKQVYDKGLKEKKISYYDREKGVNTIEIDFSHPEDVFAPKSQDSLF